MLILKCSCKYTYFKVGLQWQELFGSVQRLEFSGGNAEIAEVTRCTGDVSSRSTPLVFFLS